MEKNHKITENKQISQLTTLVSYSVFSVILIGESLLMGWEIWALPLIAIGVISAWGMHIVRKPADDIRMWVNTILMMVTFFFYGIHPTSMFDMVAVAGCVIIIFTMVGETKLIYSMVITYYFTLAYDVIEALSGGTEFDALNISRLFLHIIVMIMFGRVSIIIINRRRNEIQSYDAVIDELQETNRRTEDFLTNVSHELRTPINAVTGITSVVIKKIHNEEIREEIKSVRQAGNRLLEQVAAILDYTEIDTGRLVISNEEYMITSIVHDIITEKQVLQTNNKTELVFDLDADIPSKLEGDGVKIKKILKNVISNAVKFTKEGGVYVRISALKKSYGINLCIDVEDTGIGMSSREMERIKEKFYQVNSSRSRRAGGLGLGLSIVYGLVSAMGGFVKLDSQAGKGTKIHISIPQKVIDSNPSVVVANRDKICAVCFIRLEKYDVPRVREFYSDMISNTSYRLGIKVYNVHSRADLEKMRTIYRITHLFVDREEYSDNIDYLNGFDRDTRIVVICDDDFDPVLNDRTYVIKKPFHSLAVANIFNSGSQDALTDDIEGKRMICPGVRALVVDDESMNLTVASGIFKDYGMNVRTVLSGLEAIKKCEEEEFDIIFLDHMMPEMDGIETLRNLRTLEKTKGRHFTIVALTANAVSGAREMFMSAGFDGFVPKPIEYSDLERVLKRVLPKASIDYISKDEGLSDKERETEGDSENESLLKLKKTGIDTATGIKYCRNDIKFYLELLDNFVTEFEKKHSELSNSLKEGKISDYHIKVHALKSTARMLGASELSEFAKNMEDAAKKKDIPFLNSRQEELLLMYEEVVGNVADSLGMKKEEAAHSVEEIDEERLTASLEEIRSCIDTYEVEKAGEVIKGLSLYSYKGKQLRQLLGGINDAIQEFDMKTASDETESLLEKVKGGALNE